MSPILRHFKDFATRAHPGPVLGFRCLTGSDDRNDTLTGPLRENPGRMPLDLISEPRGVRKVQAVMIETMHPGSN